MTTPDTEGTIKYVRAMLENELAEPRFIDALTNYISQSLTSRDTYWKEQLQNARIDWLRSEIEKLEGEIRIADEIPDTLTDIWQRAHNKTITSIITRYKEELKVLESVK